MQLIGHERFHYKNNKLTRLEISTLNPIQISQQKI